VVLAQMVKFLLQATEVNYELPASILLVLSSGNSLLRPSYKGCLSFRKMTWKPNQMFQNSTAFASHV